MKSERSSQGVAAKKGIRLAVLLLLLFLFIWQLLQAPWFLVLREIEVHDAVVLGPWDVEQIAGAIRGTSLMKVDVQEMQRRLEADERILQAEVKKHWPGTLVITVQENVGAAAVPYFNNWLEVNIQGRILSVTRHFSALNLPVVTGLDVTATKVGDSLANQLAWQVASDCLSRMPSRLLEQISEINVANVSSIILYSRDPLRIIVGDHNNLEQKFRALAGMLDKIRGDQGETLSSGQLDVSSGKAVFVKEP